MNKTVGSPGFDILRFKGKPIVFDDLKISSTEHTLYFDHLYRTSYFHINNGDAGRVHSCLYFNSWCWSDAVEHPSQAYKFIARRIRAWILSR